MHQPVDPDDISTREIEILCYLFQKWKTNERDQLIEDLIRLGSKLARKKHRGQGLSVYRIAKYTSEN